VKFIDLNKQFEDFYYFDPANGYYYMEMNPYEEKALNLRMENPYLEQTNFDLSSSIAPPAVPAGHETISFHHGSPPANKTTTATLAAATSDKYTISEEYYLKITAPESGEYDINVMAKTHEITDMVRVHLVVKKPPIPPIADFIAIPREGITPLVVDFYDKSKDDGTIIAWQWNFGDTSASTPENQKQNPAHTYESEGPFKVKLTVTDNIGLTGSVEKEIVPYTKTRVLGLYAPDITVQQPALLGATCNKDHLNGTLQLTDENSEAVYTNPNYKCNSGIIQTPPIIKSGIYIASFKLDTKDCTVCQMTWNMLAKPKAPELQTPENPIIEITVCIIVLLGIALRKKSSKPGNHV
jgi:PKD repeat protein